MIQNFETQGGVALGQKNIPLLRAYLKSKKLDGVLIAHRDEYNNEYLPLHTQRLKWASGFTGSAGFACVLNDSAAIFVDGRYRLQVKAQVCLDIFNCHELENNGVTQWLAMQNLTDLTIGYDPHTTSTPERTRFKAAIEKAGGRLQNLSENAIDACWQDRPSAPCTPVSIQPLAFAGRAHLEKRTDIATALKARGAQANLITNPNSLAWILNIRGQDVMCTPLTLGRAILHDDTRIDLFIDKRKLSDEIYAHFGTDIMVHDEEDFLSSLTMLAGKNIWVDNTDSSCAIYDSLTIHAKSIIEDIDPIALPKACKNQTEINATKQAHYQDGIALCRFLHWLDTQGQHTHCTEITAAQKLESFRHETGYLQDLSFESISGVGANGAIIHYRVTQETCQPLTQNTLYLIDSGGQYQQGTTDITRTIAIGTPTQEMQQCFTLVLKAHIALARARFPIGTTGQALDAITRNVMWQNGLDYDHGTGHGVGVYLGVHEGPQRIAKHGDVALQAGMIVSNEPGFYKTNAFGIRIENLQYIYHACPVMDENGTKERFESGRDMMGFHVLSFAPIDKNLILVNTLSQEETKWLNAYHQKVYTKISPALDTSPREWLARACAPL